MGGGPGGTTRSATTGDSKEVSPEGERAAVCVDELGMAVIVPRARPLQEQVDTHTRTHTRTHAHTCTHARTHTHMHAHTQVSLKVSATKLCPLQAFRPEG